MLRIKVLVPTWLPKPPVFPSFELPSLMVRLPGRATGAVSERIEGTTWAGIQRTYQFYPLQAGTFRLPPGEVEITYADPGKPDPIQFNARVPDTVFSATVPPGAQDLSPLVIAQGFFLEQTLQGDPEMAAGDAITRTLTATIEGTTAVLIPSLSPIIETEMLRGYPKEPVVSEVENDRVLSGTRTETATFVGLSGGNVTLPEISVQWFNLQTGAVETATVPGVELVITGEIAKTPEPLDPLDLALWVGRVIIALGLAWLVWRLAGPQIASGIVRARRAWRQSEHVAQRAVIKAMGRRDLSATFASMQDWMAFYPDAADHDRTALEVAVTGIGAARYGRNPGPDTNRSWAKARAFYKTTRRQLRLKQRQHSAGRALPPLNP